MRFDFHGRQCGIYDGVQLGGGNMDVPRGGNRGSKGEDAQHQKCSNKRLCNDTTGKRLRYKSIGEHHALTNVKV